MRTTIVIAALFSGAILLAFGTPEDKGKDLFTRRCAGCHALDVTKEGPPLRSIYGRKAASVAGFDYSAALKGVGVRWDAATLDRWLTDPDAMASGTNMEFQLPDAEERAAVIAYLKSLPNPP